MTALRRTLALGCFASMAAAVAFACGGDDSSPTAPSDAGPGLDALASDGAQDDGASLEGAAGDGGAGDAADGGDDLGELAEFCDKLATAICERRVFCFPEVDQDCDVNTRASCREYARAEVAPAIADGLLTYDAAVAKACFDSPAQDACLTNNLLGLPACQGIFKGQVADQGDCYPVYFFGDLDMCATGGCVRSGPPSGPGCMPGSCKPFLAPGAACFNDAGAPILPGCGPAAFCTSGTCVAAKAIGDSCTNFGDPCAAGAKPGYCLPLLDGGEGGVCDQPRGGGANCKGPDFDISSACRSLICDHGTCADYTDAGDVYCLVPTHCSVMKTCVAPGDGGYPTCQPAIPSGGTCYAAGNGAGCDTDLTCVFDDAGDTQGTCQPLSAAGQGCGNGCSSGLRCVTLVDGGNTCVEPLAPAADCSAYGSNPCSGALVCNAKGVCGAQSGNGAACAADGECERGLYCADASKTCRPWKRNGQACARDGECLYGSGCDDGGVCASICGAP